MSPKLQSVTIFKNNLIIHLQFQLQMSARVIGVIFGVACWRFHLLPFTCVSYHRHLV
jgi:hypothetical protein